MREIKTLSVDIETYCGRDLKKSGVYPYAESPDFEILLFACSVNDEEVRVYDLAMGERIPEDILRALTDDRVEKWAYNASFERICLSAWLRRHEPDHFKGYGREGKFLSPASWKCSQVWGAFLGLPMSLKDIGSVLRLSERKLKEGESLVRFFCMPCRPTGKNGGRTRNLPCHDPEKWELFKAYNKRDVETETAVRRRLERFPVPEFIWDEYRLDQEINDRGILLDGMLVQRAVELDAITKDDLTDRMKARTGLDNPNSVMQMKRWLSENGTETETLDKKAVSRMMENAGPSVRDVLECRQQLAKSSVKKYTAMMNARCPDGRARGMFRFYGANRSGRWSGRLIQLQNLPQNHMEDLKEARDLVRSGNFEAVRLLYDNVPAVLSELIRTALIPSKGRRFIVADFSAIEARVLSFLANEKWRNEVFAAGKDIYCESASRMFRVPVEKNGINGHLRQKGKIAELALGYGGSVGALKAMGALDMGLEESELQTLTDAWRAANPNITRLWWDVDEAVRRTVIYRTNAETHGIGFRYAAGMMFIVLPSGRRLAYVRPRMGTNRFGSDSVTYEGISAGKWERIESYGPKFVENIVQAVSRDILAYALKQLREYPVCGHVHDEIIVECGPEVTLSEIRAGMEKTPPWIKGLQLRADGYECDFYQKQ